MVYAQKSSALLITALAISAVTFAAPTPHHSKIRKHHPQSTSMNQNMGNLNQDSSMENNQQLPSTIPTDPNQVRAFDGVEIEERDIDDLEERGVWKAGKEILYRDLGEDGELHLRELDEDEIAMFERDFDDLEERGLWRAGKAIGKSVGKATKAVGKGVWQAGEEILYRDLENDDEMYRRDLEERSYDLDQLD